MLKWAAIFFALAILAALLGFGGIAGSLSWAAQVLFVGFLLLMIASAVAGAIRSPA